MNNFFCFIAGEPPYYKVFSWAVCTFGKGNHWETVETSYYYTFSFKNDDDAIAFKLKWVV